MRNAEPPTAPSAQLSPHKSTRGEEATPNPFVDLDSLGLRRGGRMKQRSLKLKESHHTDPKNKELRFHSPKALMILALSAFTSTTTEMCNSIHQCYQARAVEYHDFLETNFDGSVNSLNPLAHIYLSTQSNNEVYNLKEMLQQPDKEYFGSNEEGSAIHV